MKYDRIIHDKAEYSLVQMTDENIQVDLLVADPPYNIGIPYDGCNDNVTPQYYQMWMGRWIRLAVPCLKPSGSIYIIVPDEQVAMTKRWLDSVDLTMRNWIIWYYTFGEAQQKKFSRCKAHVLYYVKDPNNFTFNADAVRIPSDRQLKYDDPRAKENGKLPDDVWQIPRVCGTHKERIEGFPCQLPEKLLERIILTSSNPGDLVLDCFFGSGTTGSVAKRLGRQWLGIEQSPKYAAMAAKRIAKVDRGFSLGV